MRILLNSLKAIVGLLVLTGIVTGQANNAWLTDTERIRFDQLRDNGFEALYNLDYETATFHFSDIARSFPQHPAGSQYLASTLLLETLYKSRRLQASLYSSKSFYSGSDDKADPKVIKQFRTLTREAQRLAEARLKEYPKDTEALYFLGNVAAAKASFEEAVERRHFAALRDGSEAVAKHRMVVQLDPNYVDAELTIGMYEYVVGSLPFPVKLMAGIFGAQGSKKRGIATIERVAKLGKASRDQARSLLVILYFREKRYSEAAEQARQLSAKYPRNYLYRLETADALVSQATAASKIKQTPGSTESAAEAYSIYQSLLRDKEVAGTQGHLKDLIHFKYGEALMKTGRNEQAVMEFLSAAKTEEADEKLVTMAHLYAAEALDAENKRGEALAQYRLVLSRPDAYDAHVQARKRLAERR
ncbi:MAG TPA: hypothetical protein VFS77_16565 [Pyrinomonadaceae bacterium]|nr:hypothetical protein [Pyrinomonadaceae bacterium]